MRKARRITVFTVLSIMLDNSAYQQDYGLQMIAYAILPDETDNSINDKNRCNVIRFIAFVLFVIVFPAITTGYR